jgi:hypothetical protein
MSETYAGGGSIDVLPPFVLRQIRAIAPATVVDFGAGRGLMGRLCREAVGASAHLTAVEGCAATVAGLQRAEIYDRVAHAYINDWVAGNRQSFDLAIYGDVLEHLTRRQAFAALGGTLQFARNVIVNVPLRNLHQDGVEANPLEEHKAYFTEQCFLRRYVMQELHVINAGSAATAPGWEMMNGWIVGRKRFRIKRAIKEEFLLRGGKVAKNMLEWVGASTY